MLCPLQGHPSEGSQCPSALTGTLGHQPGIARGPSPAFPFLRKGICSSVASIPPEPFSRRRSTLELLYSYEDSHTSSFICKPVSGEIGSSSFSQTAANIGQKWFFIPLVETARQPCQTLDILFSQSDPLIAMGPYPGIKLRSSRPTSVT